MLSRKLNLLITICARGGSKGIPGKNLSKIANLPLLSYSTVVAREFGAKFDADYGFSTDSVDIIDLAKSLGFGTDYLRPAHLATDSAGKIDTIHDLIKYEESKNSKKYDYILDLDITSPLRTVDDLDIAFALIQSNPVALNLFSVNKANRNPYFNQVEIKENGFFDLVKKTQTPVLTRQSAPKVWDLNASFYFYRRSFFDLNYRNAYTERSIIYEMPHMCFDLDEKLDFTIMSYLIENELLDFELMKLT